LCVGIDSANALPLDERPHLQIDAGSSCQRDHNQALNEDKRRLDMPKLQTVLAKLNNKFGSENKEDVIAFANLFGPGKPFDAALAGLVADKGTPLYELFKSYLSHLPGSIQAAESAIIQYALSTEPATMVTFAWAPSYDYELTVWQSPDNETTRGGITVLLKSRYPGDKAPFAEGVA
jgi:hypothetical protein